MQGSLDSPLDSLDSRVVRRQCIHSCTSDNTDQALCLHLLRMNREFLQLHVRMPSSSMSKPFIPFQVVATLVRASADRKLASEVHLKVVTNLVVYELVGVASAIRKTVAELELVE